MDRALLGVSMMARVAMAAETTPPGLRRALTLPLVVLYGLGVTIGAGIYVLVGEAAARAGFYAPVAFVIAGVAMLGPAASYAELSGRLPFAAGQVHFIEEGVQSRFLGLLTGLAVTIVGVVSAAAIALGATGYIRAVLGAPHEVTVVAVVLSMGVIAAWGVKESLMFAGVLTLIEIGGLLAVIAGGLASEPDLLARLHLTLPPLGETDAWRGVFSASLLGFFAFIGFENIVNMAEEAHRPQKTVSRAIFITLGLSTLLYFGVVVVSVLAVPPSDLAGHDAPLALVFARVTGLPPLVIALIAIVATLNGIIAQIIMSARILYGLSQKAHIPAVFGRIDMRTRTPLVATAFATVLVLALALAFPIAELAEWTSRVTLGVIVLVCGSLILIKRRGTPAPEGTFIAPMWMPVFGILAALGLLIAGGA
jgi:amino acid transporter